MSGVITRVRSPSTRASSGRSQSVTTSHCASRNITTVPSASFAPEWRARATPPLDRDTTLPIISRLYQLSVNFTNDQSTLPRIFTDNQHIRWINDLYYMLINELYQGSMKFTKDLYRLSTLKLNKWIVLLINDFYQWSMNFTTDQWNLPRINDIHQWT